MGLTFTYLYEKDLEVGLAFDHFLILSFSIHCIVFTYMHTTVIIPSSQAAKHTDTNSIAITDAKLNLARSIKMEVISVYITTETPTQGVGDLTYLYPGVHLLEVLRTIFTPKKCSLFGYGGVHTS